MNMNIALLETYQITLIIIAIAIVGIYILGLILTVTSAFFLKRRIKKMSANLNIIIVERKDIANQLYKLAEKNDVQINPIHKKNISALDRINDFQSLKKKTRDAKMLNLIYSSSTITSLLSNNKNIAKMDEYSDLMMMYNDAETSYRQMVSKYNSDVIGYNYWIHIIFYRFLFLIAKKKDLDLII